MSTKKISILACVLIFSACSSINRIPAGVDVGNSAVPLTKDQVKNLIKNGLEKAGRICKKTHDYVYDDKSNKFIENDKSSCLSNERIAELMVAEPLEAARLNSQVWKSYQSTYYVRYFAYLLRAPSFEGSPCHFQNQEDGYFDSLWSCLMLEDERLDSYALGGLKVESIDRYMNIIKPILKP
jgi:hypothetical protein